VVDANCAQYDVVGIVKEEEVYGAPSHRQASQIFCVIIVHGYRKITHLVTHLVWPHGDHISMRPRALKSMQNP